MCAGTSKMASANPITISSTGRNKLHSSLVSHSNWISVGNSPLSRSNIYNNWVPSYHRRVSASPWVYASSVKGFPSVGRHRVLFTGRYTVKAISRRCSSLARAIMDSEKSLETSGQPQAGPQAMKVLFVEMGVGYDQHGQDITVAAMRACRDAISSNSIPAFRTGAVPGVNFDQMKLKIKLGVPHSTQGSLDIQRVKSVFPYGNIIDVEVVDGGLVCSSGVCLESLGDKNDDCYIVNAAVYVGY
eukprot:Gb_08784 [translate_table: standard]